jgi:hypothetical protein
MDLCELISNLNREKKGLVFNVSTNPSSVSVVNPFAFHNFLGTVAEAVHVPIRVVWSAPFMPSVAFICSMISSKQRCVCSFFCLQPLAGSEMVDL